MNILLKTSDFYTLKSSKYRVDTIGSNQLNNILFFEGAVSEYEYSAKLEIGNFAFLEKLVSDIGRLDYQLIYFPSPFIGISDKEFVAFFKQELIKKLPNNYAVIGYSKGARLALELILADTIEPELFASFSGAHLLNTRRLINCKAKLQNIMIKIGNGIECPFYDKNKYISDILDEANIKHQYIEYKNHYMDSFYKIMVELIKVYIRHNIDK